MKFVRSSSRSRSLPTGRSLIELCIIVGVGLTITTLILVAVAPAITP